MSSVDFFPHSDSTIDLHGSTEDRSFHQGRNPNNRHHRHLTGFECSSFAAYFLQLNPHSVAKYFSWFDLATEVPLLSVVNRLFVHRLIVHPSTVHLVTDVRLLDALEMDVDEKEVIVKDVRAIQCQCLQQCYHQSQSLPRGL